ncbi:MAG: TonB-dependent receptor [bacterium]|nr:TonB-dependent receptor [bacterium]
MRFNKVLLFLLLAGFAYSEEGTTTIPPSSLEIIGKDRSEFFIERELPTASLTFPGLSLPEKRKIEKEKKKVELSTKKPELPIISSEKSHDFKKESGLPSLLLGIGLRSQIASEFLYAQEKKERCLSFSLFREARDGFDWNEKRDFWQKSKDKGEITFGLSKEKQRIVGKLALEGEDIFLPYCEKTEKRRRAGIELEYNSPNYANLDINLFARNETKGTTSDITNRGIGTKVSFDIGQARFTIEGEGEKDRTVSSLVLALPTAKKKKASFSVDFGIDSHKGKTQKTVPHLALKLSYPFWKTFPTKISAKAGLSTPSFNELYLKDPYTAVGEGISPENILKISGDGEFYTKNLAISMGCFVQSTKDHIYYAKKEPGLYEPKNLSSTVALFGAKSNLLWRLKENMKLEAEIYLVNFNKDIPYLPKQEAGVSLEYKKRPFSLKPSVSFVGSQGEIPSSAIFDLTAEREEEKSLWFLKINNLFNTSYLKREDYPGDRLSVLVGVKMVL